MSWLSDRSQPTAGDPLDDHTDGTKGSKADRQGVQVLSRVGEILRLLKVSPGGLSQAEIATNLNLARTTIHRLLNALAKEGLVRLSGGGGRYHLGIEIIQLADAARAEVVSEAHPLMKQLSDSLEETVDLSVLDRGRMTFVDQVVSQQRLRTVSAVGASFPLHCTANGKAVLASLTQSELRRLLPTNLYAETPNTITDPERLQEELERIRSAGIAVDAEEHSLGICAIGVCIGMTTLGLLAVSMPIPAHRFEVKRKAAAIALGKTAQAIRAILTR